MTVRVDNDVASWARLASDYPQRARSLAADAATALTAIHAAFISVAAPTAGLPVRGVLAGVPVAVKDNIDTAELPTSSGSPVLAASTAPSDATAVRLLRAAGSWIVGKTNLHELAFGVTSDNGAFGAVVNPVDPSRSAGGSSGGSAVAVAMGAAPYALGTDTGGSMTIPAAYCGIVGYRPSAGRSTGERRYPADGVTHLSTTRDTIGIMTTGVADLRAVDRVLHTPATRRRTVTEVRLAICSDYIPGLDRSVEEAFDAAIRSLSDGGTQPAALRLPRVVGEARELGAHLVGYEAPVGLAGALARLTAPFASVTVADLAAGAGSADVRAILQDLLDHPVTDDVYRRALQVRTAARREFTRALRGHVDAILYPTCPTEPPLLHATEVVTRDGTRAPVFPTLTRHTEAGSVLGTPSVTIPIAGDGQLPVGLTLEGIPGDDDHVLEVAERVERALGITTSRGER